MIKYIVRKWDKECWLVGVGGRRRVIEDCRVLCMEEVGQQNDLASEGLSAGMLVAAVREMVLLVSRNGSKGD